MPQPKEKTDSIESVFSFGRSIGASRLAPQGVAVAELGSHFASKAMGARSREARRRILANGEYPSAHDGQSRTPVPTKVALLSHKGMI